MANAIYEQVREDALGGGLGWIAGDYRAALVKLDAGDAFGIAITGATNATPIVITTAAAPSTGAVVSIQGVTGNTNANGHFRVTNINATTFSIQDYLTDANIVGNGAFGGADPTMLVVSGPQFLSDIPAGARHALLTASIATKAIVAAAADGVDWTWLAVAPDAGKDSDAVVVYEDTGVEATSKLTILITQSTGLPVIPNGGDIGFVISNSVHRLFRL